MKFNENRMNKNITDYCEGNTHFPTRKDIREKEKKMLRNQARCHLKDFFRVLLKSSDRNYIEVERVIVFFLITMRKIDGELFHLKTMPNGRRRIFKLD